MIYRFCTLPISGRETLFILCVLNLRCMTRLCMIVYVNNLILASEVWTLYYMIKLDPVRDDISRCS